MKPYILVTALLAIVILAPSSSPAQSTPSLNLEGEGTIGSGSGGKCANPAGCGGSFSATLSGELAGPIASAALGINFQLAAPVPVVSTKKNAIGPSGCRSAVGTGTFDGSLYNVAFNGQFCSGPNNIEQLSGTITIAQNASSADITWAVGTLVASGLVHIPASANNIPISGPAITSIVGATGEIPQFVP